MKRFIPLFILTGLLFGQDLLLLKSGKFYKGIFIEKEGENIIFTIKGDSVHSQFSINDIDIIKTNNGDHFYPFDISTKKVQSKNTAFEQDVLNLKSGESYRGTFYGKVGENIVFKVEGETSTKKNSINDVNNIVTKNSELTYPFDTPTNKVQSTSSIFDFNTLPKKIISKQEIVNMSEEEKGFLYGKYIINPYSNMFVNLLIPTYGYYKIRKWNRGLIIASAGLALGAIFDLYYMMDNEDLEKRFDRKMNIMHSMLIIDIPIQTIKYNRNLSKYIFDQETPPLTLGTIFPLKTNYKHYFNLFGVPNHRTGVGMFGYSINKRTKNNNEYYMGIGTAIINLSITAGWKYYFKKSNADDYYLAMSLVGSTLEIDDRYDETKKVSKDFIAGNFSAGYEKRLSKNMYLNMEIFTLTGIMPNSKGVTDGIRYLVAPSFHFNYRI